MTEQIKPDRLALIVHRLAIVARPVVELTHGLKTNTIPWPACVLVSIVAAAAIMCHADLRLLQHFCMGWLYPRGPIVHILYSTTACYSGVLVWAFYRAGLFQQLRQRTRLAMITAGLKNRLGKTPNLISDGPIDEYTRKLRVTSANFPAKDFEAARPAIETALRVYIDEVRESRATGTYDLIYSKVPMPSEFAWPGCGELKPLTFMVGRTRSKLIIGNLRATPHLLVAGQTGGGKSTFLRQLITSLYLTDKHASFMLVDLKGGLEFQLFDRLPRVSVKGDLNDAVLELQHLDAKIGERLTQLRSEGVKDIDALRKKWKSAENAPKGKIDLGRHIVVIDEAAEMFLAGAQAPINEVQSARRALSRIARQGRAVGIHLIVATQRPDARALDPQVKANLTGVLCFAMANDASSMTVLGSGRATDLPLIPGRAIWKTGAGLMEVQTPFLGADDSEKLLDSYRPGLAADEVCAGQGQKNDRSCTNRSRAEHPDKRNKAGADEEL